MSHRLDELHGCETYVSRMLRKEKFANAGNTVAKPSTSTAANPAGRQRCSNHDRMSTANTTNAARGGRSLKKHLHQIPVPIVSNQSQNKDYDTDVDAPIRRKVKNKLKESGDESWGQLLLSNRTKELSSFSNFDPLRTLHFLAKELQYQLQTVLPDENNLHKIVEDMQHALKRVPPEVASSIHLQQQATELLAINRKCSCHHLQTMTKNIELSNVECQTNDIRIEKMQKKMEESTLKFEASCKQMELVCEKLKTEKEELEIQLLTEQDKIKFLNKRVNDLEDENKHLINTKLAELERKKSELEHTVKELKTKLALECNSPATVELSELVEELKKSKNALEKECDKLKHQLRLSSMEKEKYIAVLDVRDRQISEIRNEMTQLQDVVNEQLLELHNSAVATLPEIRSRPISMDSAQMEEVGDSTISSIRSTSGDGQRKVEDEDSFKELPSGDEVGSRNILDLLENFKLSMSNDNLDGVDSQQSIKTMFNNIKEQALKIKSKPTNKNTVKNVSPIKLKKRN